MTVYVDDMRAPFGRMIMCHMVADTEEELHAMADRIGVARKWHQGDHYDIALVKRKLAVDSGAVEISRLEASGICRPYMRERIERILRERRPPKIPVWLRTAEPETLTKQAELFHNDQRKQ